MVRATELAIGKAKEVGLGLGVVRHIGHYAGMCIESGCIGFSSQGHRGMGNAGGREDKPQVGFYGNPPISFAIPSGDEPPVVLDAATNILSGYDNLKGAERDELLSKIPAAFFKSMGYTAVVSLMGGAFTVFTLPDSDNLIKRWHGAIFGGTVLAINVDTVVPKWTAWCGMCVRPTSRCLAMTALCSLVPLSRNCSICIGSGGIRYGEMEQDDLRKVSER